MTRIHLDDKVRDIARFASQNLRIIRFNRTGSERFALGSEVMIGLALDGVQLPPGS